MSRKISFEDDAQKPRRLDVSDGDDSTKKRSKQPKLEHEFSRNDTQTSAAPDIQAGAALPSGDVSGGGNGNLLDLTAIQQQSANALQGSLPDETPDRNVGVSSVRFIGEVVVQSIREANFGDKQKSKRQSKLKADKSRLSFNADEKATDGVTPNTADADNRDNEAGGDAGVNNDDTENTADVSDENADVNDASDDEPTEQDTADTDGDAETGGTNTKPSNKPKSRLKFSKADSEISKLEKQADRLDRKLEKAQEKIPTKTVTKKTLEFDEKKGKAVTKLTHEKEKIPIGEAKWNKPKDKSMPTKVAGVATSMAVTKIHAKVHQVEHENVGVKVAHKAELLAESGYRGAKRTAKSAYRFHKNRPYRQVSKLEQKSIKNKMKLDYKKALRDNPKLKSSPLSRWMQKRAIKRNYAKDLRAAKNAAQTGTKAVGIVAKAGKIVTAIIRKNPVFLVKACLVALLIFLVLSLLTMCVGIFSSTTSFVGAVSYAADYEDIDDASILYTELETDLRIYINDIQINHPGYDEYRFSIDSIGHDPFALIAFLTAVYHDFTFAEVVATIHAVFNAQYTLTLVSEVEIRTGTGTDSDGYSYTYEYEWHILNVTLVSRNFTDVLLEMMDDDQTEHFNVLMYSKGARQFVGNPFDFDWRPFVTSLYGYRIHPIHGDRRFHWGLDIGQPQGVPLLAALDGVVIAVGYQADGYGNFVVIECADGNQVRYAHCHEVFVTEGQPVERGDVIATVGTTGASTGPHLHIEIVRNGRFLNPIFFMEFR